MSVTQFVDVIKPFIFDVLDQNIQSNSEIQKEISFVSKMIPTKKGKDDFLRNSANTVIAELMKYLPQPFSLAFTDGIKTQIGSQGTKFTVPFSLPPIKPHIEFDILVNDSQTFTGKMKFMINTEVTPMNFEVHPTMEKKFTLHGKLKISFSLSLIQSIALGFNYDNPHFLWEKSFEIDFSKYSLVI